MERSLKRLYDIVYITLNILHFEDIQDEIGRVTVVTFTTLLNENGVMRFSGSRSKIEYSTNPALQKA